MGLMRGWWFALLKMVIKLLCCPSRKASKTAAKEKKQNSSEDSVPAAGSGTSIKAGNKPSGENQQLRGGKNETVEGHAQAYVAHGTNPCKHFMSQHLLKLQTFTRDNTFVQSFGAL